MIISIIITSALCATTGGALIAKSGKNVNQAKKITMNSNQRVEEAAKALDRVRLQCESSLENLGKIKLNVLDGDMKEFVNQFERIKNVNFRDTVGLDELKDLNLEKFELSEIKTAVDFTISLLGSMGTGAVGGTLAAVGAYSAAMTFATASTGTAISALHGVAATNATLAWFGGGSLATGGMGVAGGTAVLGGVVAGAAVLVMGVVLGAKTGIDLEKSKTHALEAEESVQEFCAGIEQCIAIRRRTDMFYCVMARLDSFFLPMIQAMTKIINTEGEDYRDYSPESKKVIASAASLAATIKAVLDIPILNEEGGLTSESEEALNLYINAADNYVET